MFRFSSRHLTVPWCHSQRRAAFPTRPALSTSRPQPCTRRLSTDDSTHSGVSQSSSVDCASINRTIPGNAGDTASHEELGLVEEPSSRRSWENQRDTNLAPSTPPTPRSVSKETISARLKIRERYGEPTSIIRSFDITQYPQPIRVGVHTEVVTSYTLAPGNIHLPGILPTLSMKASIKNLASEQKGPCQTPSHISALQACRRLGNFNTSGRAPSISTTPNSLSKLLIDPLNSIVVATHIDDLVELSIMRPGRTQIPAKNNTMASEHETPRSWDELFTPPNPGARQGAYRYIKYNFGDLVLMVMDHTDAWRPQHTPSRIFLSKSDDPARSVDFTMDGIQVTCGGPVPEVHSTFEITTTDFRKNDYQALRRRWQRWFARTRSTCLMIPRKESTIKPVYLNTQRVHVAQVQPMQERLQRLHGVLQTLRDAVCKSKSGTCYMLNVQSNDTDAMEIDHEIFELPMGDESLVGLKDLASAKAALWGK